MSSALHQVLRRLTLSGFSCRSWNSHRRRRGDDFRYETNRAALCIVPARIRALSEDGGRIHDVDSTASAVCLVRTCRVSSCVERRVAHRRRGIWRRFECWSGFPRQLQVDPAVVDFPDTLLGTQTENSAILENDGSSTEGIDLLYGAVTFSGPGADDYQVLSGGNCPHPQEVGGDPTADIILDTWSNPCT